MCEYNFPNLGVQQGWQCPICKRVYSPSTPMCYYCGGEKHQDVTTGTGTIPNIDWVKTISQTGPEAYSMTSKLDDMAMLRKAGWSQGGYDEQCSCVEGLDESEGARLEHDFAVKCHKRITAAINIRNEGFSSVT